VSTLTFKRPTTSNFLPVSMTGARISMSPVDIRHADDILAEFTPDITRFMYPAPVENIKQVYDFIQRSRDEMTQNKALILAIQRKDDHEFLGVCGLHGNKKSATPELGIWIKKSAHGQKLGREAIHTLVNWAKAKLSIEAFHYPCDKDNVASRKIADSLNGIIISEGIQQSMSGKTLNEIVYEISLST